MKFVVTRSSKWNEEPEPGMVVEAVASRGYADQDRKYVDRSVIELETIDQLMEWMRSLPFPNSRGVVIWDNDQAYGYELPQIEIYDERRES